MQQSGPNHSVLRASASQAALAFGATAMLLLAGCAGGGGGDEAPMSQTATNPTPTPSNPGGSGSVEVAWTPPTTKVDGSALTDLAGYRFYLGRESGRYVDTVSVSNPGLSRYVFDNLQSGTWYVAMTSVRSNGIESDLSNEVAKMAN